MAATEGSGEILPDKLKKSYYPSGYRTVLNHHTLVTTRDSAQKLRKAGADIKEFRLPSQDDDKCDFQVGCFQHKPIEEHFYYC